jgi:hypothetical protein
MGSKTDKRHPIPFSTILSSLESYIPTATEVFLVPVQEKCQSAPCPTGIYNPKGHIPWSGDAISRHVPTRLSSFSKSHHPKPYREIDIPKEGRHPNNFSIFAPKESRTLRHRLCSTHEESLITLQLMSQWIDSLASDDDAEMGKTRTAFLTRQEPDDCVFHEYHFEGV